MKTLRFFSALLLLVLLFSVPAAALSLPAGSGDAFYVQDTANVLSAETQETIAAYNVVLEECCHQAQLVVVTVNYLDEDTEVASLQLMNDWGVGSQTESNGMLLLLVANEYRGWLATGDGIDEVFTDSLADGYMEDYFWPYIDNDMYDEGVSALAGALYHWYLDYYGVEDAGGVGQGYGAEEPDNYGYYYDYDYDPASSYRYEQRLQRTAGAARFVVYIVIFIAIWLLVSNRQYRRMRQGGYTGSFWPIFFYGRSRYNNWHDPNRYNNSPGPPPPSDRHGGGFGGFGGFGGGQSGGFGGGGFGGHGGGGGGGRH